MRKLLWSSVDRWGPGAVALIALLAALWYGRYLEGRLDGLHADVAEHNRVEAGLREEVARLKSANKSAERQLQEMRAALSEADGRGQARYDNLSTRLARAGY